MSRRHQAATPSRLSSKAPTTAAGHPADRCIAWFNSGNGYSPNFDTQFDHCQAGFGGISGFYLNHNALPVSGNKTDNNGTNAQRASEGKVAGRMRRLLRLVSIDLLGLGHCGPASHPSCLASQVLAPPMIAHAQCVRCSSSPRVEHFIPHVAAQFAMFVCLPNLRVQVVRGTLPPAVVLVQAKSGAQ